MAAVLINALRDDGFLLADGADPASEGVVPSSIVVPYDSAGVIAGPWRYWDVVYDTGGVTSGGPDGVGGVAECYAGPKPPDLIAPTGIKHELGDERAAYFVCRGAVSGPRGAVLLRYKTDSSEEWARCRGKAVTAQAWVWLERGGSARLFLQAAVRWPDSSTWSYYILGQDVTSAAPPRSWVRPTVRAVVNVSDFAPTPGTEPADVRLMLLVALWEPALGLTGTVYVTAPAIYYPEAEIGGTRGVYVSVSGGGGGAEPPDTGPVAYVAPQGGDDSSAIVGRIDRPFSSIQAAVDAVHLEGGGCVQLLPGTYVVGSATSPGIIIKPGVVVRGTGATTRIVSQAKGYYPWFVEESGWGFGSGAWGQKRNAAVRIIVPDPQNNPPATYTGLEELVLVDGLEDFAATADNLTVGIELECPYHPEDGGYVEDLLAAGVIVRNVKVERFIVGVVISGQQSPHA